MALVERRRESSPSPSSSSTRQPKYDVFLSFRGEDTRTNFTGHLYVALKEKGIITFRDEEELKKGERISELFKAIEESQFAIIILSKNYASSTWCLDELVKIIKCEDEMGLKVLPIFYDVSPSDVRKQTETFEQAFIDHQRRFEDNMEKVKTWRDTLKKVAIIKGWDLHLRNRHESEIIQDIVKDIMEKLSSKSSSINKDLIGIKSMVAKLIPSYLGFGNEIYMMGIYGMGGLGKTTLACAIYEEYSDHFEGSSFIANVREVSENGKLHELQQQLLDEILRGSNTKICNVHAGVNIINRSGLRQKKVLLVLDDVNHKDQLQKLAGGHDWFGLGSWIIITTRDELVLKQHRVLKKYKPNGLDDDGALTLFCLNAFNKVQPEEGYMQLSQDVVKYASGLPLALVTLGSFLVGKTVEEWQSALDSLINIKGDIHDILKISYNGLEEMWKEIFLDIVCFFRRWNKDKVIKILKNCGFNAEIGISVLVEKSLLTIDGNKYLGMHDLLAEMGQKIIRFESGGQLGKRSRLWLVEDLLHVLENDMATEAIQAVVVKFQKEDFNLEDFSEGFSKMSNLRLLVIDGIHYFIYQRHFALPNNLRFLVWRSCPFKCLVSSHKGRMEFVHLDLKFSQLEYLWEGAMQSYNLKFIDLTNSQNLIRTPDFSCVPILEELRLSYCYQLVEIHSSIGELSKLRYLDLGHCENLTDLPCMSTAMQSLTVLVLSRCYKISSFPKFTGIMKSLSTLNLDWTAIKKVETSSIECLTALETLDLSECSELISLPRLPSNVRCIVPEGFSFLNWSPEWIKLSIWSQPPSQWLPFDESGSPVGFTKLFRFLRGLIYRDAVLGGYIIQSWSAVKAGFSINIKLPSNWYNSEWIGFALWASLSIPRVVEVKDGIRARVNHCAFEDSTTYIDKGKDKDRGKDKNEDEDKICDKICLLYLSREDWFRAVGNDECSQITVMFENKNSILSFFENCNGNSSYSSFGYSSFENDNSSYSTVQIRGECGFNLIYEQGVVRVDELNETNAPCFIESFGKVSIYKLTGGDDDVHIVDDDVHIVDDDSVLEFRDDVHKFGDDDFDDSDIE